MHWTPAWTCLFPQFGVSTLRGPTLRAPFFLGLLARFRGSSLRGGLKGSPAPLQVEGWLGQKTKTPILTKSALTKSATQNLAKVGQLRLAKSVNFFRQSWFGQSRIGQGPGSGGGGTGDGVRGRLELVKIGIGQSGAGQSRPEPQGLGFKVLGSRFRL